MRVGIHADPAAHSVPGGVGVYVRRLVDALLASPGRHEIHPIVTRFAEPPTSWPAESLIRPQLPFAALYSSWNFLGRPPLDQPLDVVHATGLAVPPARGARLVSTVHDLAVERLPEVVPQPWRTIYRRGLKVCLERSVVILAVSEATKTGLVEAHGVDADRIVVTPEAPNVTPGSPSNDAVLDRLALDGPYILNVGTIEPRKNQVRLVNAFARAMDGLPDHRLVLAGIPGWGQEQVEEAIGRLRVGHRVTLTGKVTNLDLASLYGKASVFALPSLYEGFGIPLVEALAFGIPSVCSTTPALTELAGDAALTVEAADIDPLAEALVKLATDTALRNRLSAAAVRRAAGYSWERTAELTLAAYERAAG